MNWVILGGVGGGVTVMHIDTNQGMTYSAAQKLADEINAMYTAQRGVQRIGEESAADKVMREMAESFIKFINGDPANQ